MTHNHLVPGSSPGGTTLKTPLLEGFFVLNIQNWCLCTILCTTYIFSIGQDYGTMCTILFKKRVCADTHNLNVF